MTDALGGIGCAIRPLLCGLRSMMRLSDVIEIQTAVGEELD